MRSAALCLLGVCFGCNQIFGLNPTVQIDAAGPGLDAPDAAFVYGSLRWVVPDSPDGSMVKEVPISPAPTLLVGPAISMGPLAPATYNADGTFNVPFDLIGRTWRLVYTMPNETVPHEIQWIVMRPHLVVPRVSRLEAGPVPANSNYHVTATGFPTTPGFDSLAMVVTSGTFTNSPVANGERSQNTITFDYGFRALPILGAKAPLDGAKGDWLMAVEWQHQTLTTDVVSGVAWTNQVALTANTTSMIDASWKNNVVTKSTPTNSAVTTGRLLAALGNLRGTGANAATQGHVTYGLSPSAAINPFVPATAGYSPFRVGMSAPYEEVPLVLPLFDDASNPEANPQTFSLVDVPTQVLQPHVLYSRVQDSRDAGGGLLLTSSLALVTSGLDETMYPAAMSTLEMLDTTPLYANDRMPFAATPMPVTLTFTPEAGQSAERYTVTLYEIAGTSLRPIRIFDVVTPTVKIDGALLVSGHSYAFEIVAKKGYANAMDGDLATIATPLLFGASTKFAGTIIVQ
ncbi:MAG: hypothetical protein JWO36_970 [Myxococcales bacterium]|nr:hypothetical protein [Myxococcales bacterium]